MSNPHCTTCLFVHYRNPSTKWYCATSTWHLASAPSVTPAHLPTARQSWARANDFDFNDVGRFYRAKDLWVKGKRCYEIFGKHWFFPPTKWHVSWQMNLRVWRIIFFMLASRQCDHLWQFIAILAIFGILWRQLFRPKHKNNWSHCFPWECIDKNFR